MKQTIQDHPVIARMERSGWPEGREPEVPRCPGCGQEAEVFYRLGDVGVIGCDMCISREDAWKIWEEGSS